MSMSDRQAFAQAMFGDDLFERGAQRLHGTVQLRVSAACHSVSFTPSMANAARETCDDAKAVPRSFCRCAAMRRPVQLRHRLCANTISCRTGRRRVSGPAACALRSRAAGTGAALCLRPAYAVLLGLRPGEISPGRMSYERRRLRLHGLIERVPKTHC